MNCDSVSTIFQTPAMSPYGYLLFSMLLISLGRAFDPVLYQGRTESTTECPPARDTSFPGDLLEALTVTHQRLPPQGCLRATRVSCADILYCNPSASSGYYQIQADNGSLVQVYCDMEGTNCGGEGGWTRVTYLNMTNSFSQCPNNFSIMTINEKNSVLKIMKHVSLYHLKHMGSPTRKYVDTLEDTRILHQTHLVICKQVPATLMNH